MLHEKGIFAPTFCPWNVADEKTWYAGILNCHHLKLHGNCHDLQCLLMILTENSFQGLWNAFNAVDFTIMAVLWMKSCFHFLLMLNFNGDHQSVGFYLKNLLYHGVQRKLFLLSKTNKIRCFGSMSSIEIIFTKNPKTSFPLKPQSNQTQTRNSTFHDNWP